MITLSGKAFIDCQQFNPAQFLLDNACIDVSAFYYSVISNAHESGYFSPLFLVAKRQMFKPMKYRLAFL